MPKAPAKAPAKLDKVREREKKELAVKTRAIDKTKEMIEAEKRKEEGTQETEDEEEEDASEDDVLDEEEEAEALGWSGLTALPVSNYEGQLNRFNRCKDKDAEECKFADGKRPKLPWTPHEDLLLTRVLLRLKKRRMEGGKARYALGRDAHLQMKIFWCEWLDVWLVNQRTQAHVQDRVKYLLEREFKPQVNPYTGNQTAAWVDTFRKKPHVDSLDKIKGEITGLMEAGKLGGEGTAAEVRQRHKDVSARIARLIPSFVEFYKEDEAERGHGPERIVASGRGDSPVRAGTLFVGRVVGAAPRSAGGAARSAEQGASQRSAGGGGGSSSSSSKGAPQGLGAGGRSPPLLPASSGDMDVDGRWELGQSWTGAGAGAGAGASSSKPRPKLPLPTGNVPGHSTTLYTFQVEYLGGLKPPAPVRAASNKVTFAGTRPVREAFLSLVETRGDMADYLISFTATVEAQGGSLGKPAQADGSFKGYAAAMVPVKLGSSDLQVFTTFWRLGAFVASARDLTTLDNLGLPGTAILQIRGVRPSEKALLKQISKSLNTRITVRWNGGGQPANDEAEEAEEE